MAAASGSKKALTYFLGKCLPSTKQNAARIRIKKLKLDERILMYFNDYEYVYAHDPQKLCKTGDTVLIQTLPEKLTRLITHEIVEVIYPLGDITDPVTGKKIVASQYREDIAEITKMYGKCESAFEYEKAPPRGRLEGKRDFTDKDTYFKYHEYPDDPQPYAVRK